jgi:hypothetical protein
MVLLGLGLLVMPHLRSFLTQTNNSNNNILYVFLINTICLQLYFLADKLCSILVNRDKWG